MKKENIIQKFFDDMTDGIREEVITTGITEPKALLLTTDSDGDYCICGITLPPSFGPEMSIEKMVNVKSLIEMFIGQVNNDGHKIQAVLHCEYIDSFGDEGEHLFIFKKFWNSEDENENNKNITTELLKINRKGVSIDDKGELVHEVELENV